MPRAPIASHDVGRLGPGWQALIYPALKRFPAAQRQRVLQRARETELDATERVGIIAAVVIAALLLQEVSDGASGIFMRYLTQFVLALPLLGCLVAPWLLRRTRRGLTIETARFYGGDEWTETQPTPARKKIDPGGRS